MDTVPPWDGGVCRASVAGARGRLAVLLVAIGVCSSSALANGFHTAHQFAVSESGSAAITVPIQVPRGIGGMEPQLALSYSSGSGNGLLGLGWSLTGPSAITRCAKTEDLDGDRGEVAFKKGDRYCLDGQRLVMVGPSASSDDTYGTHASEFRTERESFSRVRAYGPYTTSQPTVPLRFTVETKAGLTLDFGLSSNSRVVTNFVEGVTTPQTINRWLLQRITDKHGSFVEFVYCSGELSADASTCSTTAWQGSTVLHYIRYTNRGGSVNGGFGVLFRYESRPDRVQAFHAGSASRQTQRLIRVETRRGFAGPASPGTLVRSYALGYEPLVNASGASIRATNASRLRSIQESDADGNVLPPMSFSMASDAVFGQYVRHSPSAAVAVPVPVVQCGGVVGSRSARTACP